MPQFSDPFAGAPVTGNQGTPQSNQSSLDPAQTLFGNAPEPQMPFSDPSPAPQPTPQAPQAQQSAPQFGTQTPQTAVPSLDVEIPERIKALGGRVGNFSMVDGQAKLIGISFGDQQSVDEDGQTHVYPGDPKHRLRFNVQYTMMGQPINTVITITIDKGKYDAQGKLIDRVESDFMHKRADAELDYLFKKIFPNLDYQWSYATVSQLVGRDLSAQNPQPFPIYNDGQYFKLVPFDYGGSGLGAYLDANPTVSMMLMQDPTYPGRPQVSANVAQINFKQFKSGRRQGEHYFEIVTQIDDQLAQKIQQQLQTVASQMGDTNQVPVAKTIGARNFFSNQRDATTRLSSDPKEQNRNISLMFQLYAFFGIQYNPACKSYEEHAEYISEQLRNSDRQYAVQVMQNGTYANGQPAYHWCVMPA